MENIAYFRVELIGVSPEKFCEAVGNKIGGNIMHRRHDGSPFNNLPLQYWQSAKLKGGGADFHENLAEKIRSFCEALISSEILPLVDITLQFALPVDEVGSVQGFFLQAASVEMLSKISASIDVDFS